MDMNMDPELDVAADVAHDGRRGTPPNAGWADSPGAPRLSEERIALGLALEARAGEIGRMVDQQFAEDLRGNAFGTARLGAELIGRWRATDERWPPTRPPRTTISPSWPPKASRPLWKIPFWPAWPRPTSPGETSPSPC